MLVSALSVLRRYISIKSIQRVHHEHSNDVVRGSKQQAAVKMFVDAQSRYIAKLRSASAVSDMDVPAWL
jgi:hypothetical protein